MLLSASELLELVNSNVITNVDRMSINAASIDVFLSKDFLKEKNVASVSAINLAKREAPDMESYKDSVILAPGEFCLAATIEKFNLPDNVSGMFLLKSSLARAGLEHSQAGFIDSGFSKSVLTLELSNVLKRHALILQAGMAIGQVVFFRHTKVPFEFLYSTKGRYNGDLTVQGIKA